MLKQYRLSIDIPGKLSEQNKFKYNVILIEVFEPEERLAMGPHGRHTMLNIMYDCIEEVKRRCCPKGVGLSENRTLQIIAQNKWTLLDTLEEELNAEQEYYKDQEIMPLTPSSAPTPPYT